MQNGDVNVPLLLLISHANFSLENSQLCRILLYPLVIYEQAEGAQWWFVFVRL